MEKFKNLYDNLVCQLEQTLPDGFKNEIIKSIQDIRCPNGHNPIYTDIKISSEDNLEKWPSYFEGLCCENALNLIKEQFNMLNKSERIISDNVLEQQSNIISLLNIKSPRTFSDLNRSHWPIEAFTDEVLKPMIDDLRIKDTTALRVKDTRSGKNDAYEEFSEKSFSIY